MVRTSGSSFITPPEEEVIYPYHRVWPSLALQAGGWFVITVGTYAAINFVGFVPPASLNTSITLGLLALPLFLWLIFALGAEQRVPEPRRRLLAVLIVSALVANAVGLPLIDGVFQPNRWLSLASAVDRIVGYTFTVGIVQEFLKYLVVRYIVWPDYFRTRVDAVAYGIAGAIGYATVINFQFVLTNAVPLDAAALYIFDTLTANLAGSIIVSYGFAEVRFGNPTAFLLTITIALAALVNGALIPLRAGLVNADFFFNLDVFSLQVSAPSPLLGLGLSAAAAVGVVVVVAFLYANAERRAREAQATREV
ncbi:MAG: PrsW family intramembrane metalloprotease [Chloroflexi bacterium]|nr:PrsW family intramembrane metalloprotease [Chloroflexota bacterium]